MAGLYTPTYDPWVDGAAGNTPITAAAMQKIEQALKVHSQDFLNETDASALYAALAGATFTGAIRAPSVDPARTAVAGTELPSTYPAGLTTHLVTTEAGWPSATGSVMTLSRGTGLSGRVIQFFFDRETGVIHYRRSSPTADAWGNFTRIAFDTQNGVVSADTAAGTSAAFGTVTTADLALSLTIPDYWGDYRLVFIFTFHAFLGVARSPARDFTSTVQWDGVELLHGTQGVVTDLAAASEHKAVTVHRGIIRTTKGTLTLNARVTCSALDADAAIDNRSLTAIAIRLT